MNTELEGDDLEATAELPQLDLQSLPGAAATHVAGASDGLALPSFGAFPDPGKTGTWPVSAPSGADPDGGSSWQLVDELFTVRDKIVDLEAALLDTELKLAKLNKQHQELQGRYDELSGHDAEVSKERDRLDAERNLLRASHQQLKEQFDAFQAEAATSALRTQQQLEQMRQQSVADRTGQEARYQQINAEAAQHQQRIEQLLATLSTARARVTALESSLHDAEQACLLQEVAAATLARNLSHELVEKDTLHAGLVQREERIQALELAQQQVTRQLDDAEARHAAALTTIGTLQTNLQGHVQRITGLQGNLAEAEQRIARLGEQLDAKSGDWRSAEQDKERLQRLATAEHESYESTRKELAVRLAELTALQEQLLQTRNEAAELNARVIERDAALRTHEQLLADRQQLLQQSAEQLAATEQRTATLTESLGALQGDLLQSKAALDAREQVLQTVEQQMAAERQAGLLVQSQLEASQLQARQLAEHQQERDNFIVEQASELEQLQHTVGELSDHLDQAETLNRKQLGQIRSLETELASLRAEREQQGALLVQMQQELVTKGLEQGASARQVEALQSQLQQHVDALSAIRRDIHQVAQQSRHRESETQVRTLVRMDDENVVHLLNKPVMVIGRAGDAEISLPLPSVSRRHACLRVGRDVVIIEDLDSTNGCYLNGKRIKRQLLRDGDSLEIGDVQFRFATRATQGS